MCILCTGVRKLALDKHFSNSLKIDDYMARAEMVLSHLGFHGKNTIAMMNVCRDESTQGLKQMIERIYGASFTTTGLGGVLTCGQTGIGAGLSHSPIAADKERYLFLSYPHIGIHPALESHAATGDANETAGLGLVPRKGRLDHGTACGALIKCMNDLKKEGLESNKKSPGVHDPVDIEYSILKQRMARSICAEGLDVNTMNLADITKVAERRITSDLETLIEATVDKKKANYAVLTGVQIHYWTDPDATYKNEYIWPRKSYAYVDGERIELNLPMTRGLSQRQLELVY